MTDSERIDALQTIIENLLDIITTYSDVNGYVFPDEERHKLEDLQGEVSKL